MIQLTKKCEYPDGSILYSNSAGGFVFYAAIDYSPIIKTAGKFFRGASIKGFIPDLTKAISPEAINFV